MPYIVRTTIPGCGSPCGEEIECERVEESSRAVATIDDAITHVSDLLSSSPLWDDPTNEREGAEYREYAAEVQSIDERGGTIGPLPDGTVIEVEPISWARIANAVAQPWPQADRPAVFGRLIDAYNARMESRANIDRYYSSGIFTARQESS